MLDDISLLSQNEINDRNNGECNTILMPAEAFYEMAIGGKLFYKDIMGAL